MEPIAILILGILIGYLFNTYWKIRLWGRDKLIAEMNPRLVWVEWIEHYHNGIILSMIGLAIQPTIGLFFQGLAVAFIIDEGHQKHPFAYGSRHLKPTSYIGAFLILLYLIQLVYNVRGF